MSEPWLKIIGIGEDGVEGLSSLAHDTLKRAEIIIGGDRLRVRPPRLLIAVVRRAPVELLDCTDVVEGGRLFGTEFVMIGGG